MKELIDAAMQSASRQGLQGAIVLFGGGPQTVQTPAGVMAQQGAGVEVAQQVAALQEHLSQTAQQRDSALRQNEQLSTQYRESQARIAQLEATPAPPPAERPAQQPSEMINHDALGVDTLNLPDKVQKALKKNEIQTIGQLREFYPSLGECKINQKERIQTAEALMGKISGYGSAVATPAPAAATPALAGGAEDVPAGHTDRPWKDRLKVARFKENKVQNLATQLTADVAAIAAIAPDFPAEGDGNFWATALASISAIANEKQRADAISLLSGYIGSKVVQEITSSQVAAMIYALGFDPKVSRAIDASLENAGLVHLVESVPATPAA